MRNLVRLCCALAAAAFVTAASSPAAFRSSARARAFAGTINVNSTSDAASNDGLCTLREAITSANTDAASGASAGECAAGSGGDTINFSVTGTINLTGALPNIASNMTIVGPGSSQLTVRRDTGGDYRIFTVTAGTVGLSGLTATNGRTPDGADEALANGGGVMNAANLTLTDVKVDANTTGAGVEPTRDGRGGNGGGVYNSGTLTMTDCSVSGNATGKGGAGSPMGGSGGYGGGVYVDVDGVGVFNRVAVNNNSTGDFGLAASGQGGGGGGLGGGVFNWHGTVTLSGSSVSGNSTGKNFFGARSMGGGVANFGDLTVNSSLVSANVGAFGSGIGNGNGALRITNSTVSGNSGSFAVEVRDNPAATTLANSTVTANADGGIGNLSSVPPVVGNTIIAGNAADASGAFNSQGFNLVGNPDGSTGFNASGDQVGSTASPLDPLLLPLSDNGGPTKTHRLKPNSPAVDNGKNFAKDASNNTINLDQRGRSRPVLSGVVIAPGGDGSDIGAVEVVYAYPVLAGSPQSTPINTAFPTQMKLRVTESTLIAPGVTVTFTAPASGASGTFQGTGTNTASATTDSNGDVTAPVFTANSVVGSYKVEARLSAGNLTFLNLTNTKADQTINFGALPDKTYGDADFQLSATASSGLPVSFAASGDCTVSGSTVHITGVGSCTITASQPGDASYNAAPNAQRSFQISKADTTTTVTASNATYDGNPHGATANVTGPGGLNQSVSVVYSGRNGTSYGPSNTAPTNAGDYTASALFAGDASYKPSSGTKDYSIAKAGTSTLLTSSQNPSAPGQSVTFTATVTSTAGTPTGAVQFKVDGANAGAAVALNSGVATFTTSGLPAGSHAVTAEYGGDANFSASSGALSGGQTVGSLFGFGQSSYGVAEGASLTVTVTRSGDASQAVTVDYATDDGSTPSVVVPCSSVTGLALDRCDYTKALGTLRFAAGETSKTLQVLVGDDTYVEGPETARVRLSNASNGSAVGAASSATFTITDDSPESAGNAVDNTDDFVRQHYLDFLNREPDAPGFAFWVNNIDSCNADAQCREVKRINTSAAFFLSIEFQETGYLVERAYKVAFGDATSPGVAGTVPVIRLDEFLPDTQRIGRGLVVGEGAWQAQLEANKVAYFEEFVASQRFANAFPTTLTPAAFVDALFANAGVTPTAAQRQAALDAFAGDSDTANAQRRARAVRLVAENPTLNQQEKNRAFVLMQYFGYLRRNPSDAPEATLNYAGWRFWLDKLDSFGGDAVKAEMVKAFISSDEYRRRFGQ